MKIEGGKPMSNYCASCGHKMSIHNPDHSCRGCKEPNDCWYSLKNIESERVRVLEAIEKVKLEFAFKNDDDAVVRQQKTGGSIALERLKFITGLSSSDEEEEKR